VATIDWMKSLKVVLNNDDNVFTLFHYAKKHSLWALKCAERYILYLLNYFQTLLHVKLTYEKGLHINTTYTFNINLVYETYEHQNQGLVTPKLAPISLVLPIKIHFVYKPA
jgi:hypothetical protein